MLTIRTLEKEKLIQLNKNLSENMKELVEENYNVFEWDGILKGRRDNQNEVIKNCFNQGMTATKIATLVALTPKEVELRIKEMKLVRPTRTRKAATSSN